MQLDVDIGSTSTAGRIASVVPPVHIRLVEWHARESNSGSAYVGVSDVSITNGRELVPGASVTWDFSNLGRDGEPGYVLFSDLYVAFSGASNFIDWTIFIARD